MNLQIIRRGDDFYIPHRVIAKTSADHFYEQSNADAHENDRVSAQQFLIRHTAAIKSHLVRLGHPTNSAFVAGAVIINDLDALANKAAFFELVQLYNWPEDYFVTILAALGEYGTQYALEIQKEIEFSPMAAGAIVECIKSSTEYQIKVAA